MRKFLLAIVMIVLIPALVSCGSPEQAGYHGYLYFARGSYLMRFSLRDGGLSVVGNLGAKTIRDISRFGADKLLIAELASVNRKDVQRISWIDVKTGQSEALYSGTLARHLDNTGVIVYDDGLKLYAVWQGRGSGSDEMVFSHRLNQVSTMLEVSNDTLLFETGDAGERVIHSYNVATGELLALDALTVECRLSGAVWIDHRLQLACKERSSQAADAAYVFADLEGVVGGKLALPEGKRFLALTYIRNQRAVILKESWRSKLGNQDHSAVWVHHIETGESHRLAKNQNLGTSVVYTDF